MSNPKLFTPLRIRNLELENRIVIAPMCQYSAEDGCMTDWHTLHLGQLAQSGAGLLTIEAAAVSPEGRITYADVGLYDDKTEQAMAQVLTAIRKWSPIPVAIQLAHAGRKASTYKPWDKHGQIPPDRQGGWQTLAPSAVPYSDGYTIPTALDNSGLAEIRRQFAEAAKRAARLNIDLIQIHAAHGYLLHQFLSPRSNHRTDNYGGSLENRARFPLEIVDAVREAFPADKAISVRISATDWFDGGFSLEEAVAFSKMLEAHGVDAIHVSSGGLHPAQQIDVYPGYQVPLARAVKAAVGIPVVAVGLITEPEHAESIVASGDADIIAIARGALYNPRWPWHAAAALGAQVHVPNQYLRCQPHTLKNLFKS
ncbi:2,4-dienoyl-CoA reductase-like NADH-dependent reductase (Old Yellow Enzyme family) [Raoultella sp. BIGb0149]|uniref:NADH:flavin oxidoreductase/NADH oxidase n=1 Tax=Raoultella sp. BIGb0149 TaxID=2485116 RepID=UPI001060CAAD|nr:NADH:flavin oxidoreductase/NADH oxidase [Raoultella sp. BIGb0149]TDQ23334.1 2,4-dienoyl-CoA reductase-like NADH-dependent reductase (Old Yellow Enzyme family) [Raoultella sp. BIGb0149]